MLERAVAVAVATLLFGATAAAQTPEQPASRVKATAKAPAQPQPLQPAAAEPDPLTPPEVTASPAIAPGAPTPNSSASAPPAAPLDEAIVEIRKRLAAARGREAASDANNRAALVAFYGADNARVLWSDSEGFNARAKQVTAEIRKADDWGLKASAFELPKLPDGSPPTEARADAEVRLGLAILKYASHARGGRLDPPSISQLLDRRPNVYDPKTLIQAIAVAEAPDAYLRGLHPRHEPFRNLQKALIAARGIQNVEVQEPVVPRVEIPAGPRLKPGDRHPHVALVRKRLGQTILADDETLYDEALARAVREHQRQSGQQPTGIIANDTRRSLSGGARSVGPRDKSETVQRIIVNMERWRWMPDNLGDMHVWNNVPEQLTTVYKSGKAVFHERIVVGKPETPTPNFSADMQFVIFHPEWGVPNGIKTNELAPALRNASSNNFFFFGDGGRSPSTVLARFGLRASYGGREVNPDSVNWQSVDITRFNFIQPAGPKNVLGVVKFRFPNKHDVYMHDTPEKHLFSSGLRAFSHGCMRVQNPIRLAEVLLEHDKGWPAEKVRGMVSYGGGEVRLSKTVPVHSVYFTATADADGKVRYAGDLYGVDGRIASALEGRSMAIASRGEIDTSSAEVVPPAKSERPVRNRRPATASNYPGFNPFGGLFGN